MKKIISLQLPVSLTKKLEPAFIRLAEAPTTTLTQWSNFLKSMGIEPATALDTVKQVLQIPTPKSLKWHTGISTKTVTYFGFDHGDNHTTFSTDYISKIMKSLTKDKPDIIYLEPLEPLGLERIAPKRCKVVTLRSVQSNGWYMSGFALMQRIFEHNPSLKDSLTVILPTPQYTTPPRFSDKKYVEKNNQMVPWVYLRLAASLMINAVLEIETPTTPITKDNQYLFSWTTVTLFSADMASQILFHQAKPGFSKKISIGCGKAHEAQIAAFISTPELLYSFLINWTSRINTLQKDHLPMMDAPFSLSEAKSPPESHHAYVAWMHENKEFFGLK
jgi:hypothetical protein